MAGVEEVFRRAQTSAAVIAFWGIGTLKERGPKSVIDGKRRRLK
jgi:hypothetical protein